MRFRAPRPLSEFEGDATLEALSNPLRLTLFQWLLHQEPRFVSIGDVVAQLGYSRTSLTKHLAALHRAGLVCASGHGEAVRFRACASRVEGLSTFLVAECCEGHPERCMPPMAAAPALCDRSITRVHTGCRCACP